MILTYSSFRLGEEGETTKDTKVTKHFCVFCVFCGSISSYSIANRYRLSTSRVVRLVNPAENLVHPVEKMPQCCLFRFSGFEPEKASSN